MLKVFVIVYTLCTFGETGTAIRPEECRAAVEFHEDEQKAQAHFLKIDARPQFEVPSISVFEVKFDVPRVNGFLTPVIKVNELTPARSVSFQSLKEKL